MFYGLDWQLIYLAAAGAVGVLLLLLIIYIGILTHRMGKLKEKYEFFMQDETGKSVEAKLHEDVARLHDLQDSLELIHKTQKDIMAEFCLYGARRQERWFLSFQCLRS